MNKPLNLRLVCAAAAVACLDLAGVSAAAQQPTADSAVHARVDQVFAQWDHRDSPGCALGVYRDGRIAYERGYGSANLELAIPLTPQSVLDIGSTSKQFTAMSVLLLAGAGKFSLDDDVRKFIPELPDLGHRVTIRHLLTHTSGMRDYLGLWNLAGVDPGDVTTDKDALALLVRQRELNFAPGDEWLYSNSGYFLASVLVERASGKTLATFARDNIFVPLGMTHTRYNDDHMAIIPNRATAYAPRRPTPGPGLDAFATYMSNFEQTGDGGVQTSVDDLQRWDENFYTGTVGGTAALVAMQTPAMLNSGKAQSYGLGLEIRIYRGLKSVSHSGAWAGYRAELLRFPEQHLAVACLCNLATISPSRLAERTAEVYLGARMNGDSVPVVPTTAAQPPTAAAIAWSPGQTELERFAGAYYSAEIDARYDLRAENGRLVLYRRRAQPAGLDPAGPGSFRTRGLLLRFSPDSARPAEFHVEAGRVRNLRFVRQ